jgi:hypothetical protein
MSKNDHRRPCQVSPDEENLRWQLAYGEITEEQFAVGIEQLRKEGKIYYRPRYKLQKGTDDN